MAIGPIENVHHQLNRLFRDGTVAGLPEVQLLERFATRRDPAAFEAILVRHGPMVLAVCRRLLRDPGAVEDAFQATFLVLVRRAPSIRRGDALAPWLYGVAYRVALRARAQAQARQKRERATDDLDRIEPARADDDGAVELDLRRQLQEEVGRLPARYRDAVVLCHLEGLSQEDAAGRLGCPVGTIKSRLSRARDLLRHRLTRRGLALSAGLVGTMLVEPGASAAVPEALVNSTTKAATRVAAGHATAAGTVSATAVALMEGVLRTMFLNKIKLVAAVTLAAGLATGAGVLAYQKDPLRPGQAEPARGQATDLPDKPTVPHADNVAVASPNDPFQDPTIEAGVAEARDEIELLQIRLKAKQEELTAENERLKLASQVLSHRRQLAERGAASQTEVVEAESDVQAQRARCTGREAEVQELKVRIEQLRRRLANPTRLRAGAGSPAPRGVNEDWERRLRALEQRVDQLSSELDLLRHGNKN